MAIEIKQLTGKTANTAYTIIKDVLFEMTPTEKSMVTKIVYCRKGYNKGYQGDFAAYKIEFENPQFKLIIPEKNIENFIVEIIKKDDKKNLPDFAPELPLEELTMNDPELYEPADYPEQYKPIVKNIQN